MMKYIFLTLLYTCALVANLDFAFDLADQVPNKEKNWVISPLSIELALSMAAVGAKGDTEKELLDTLRLPSDFLQDSADKFSRFNASPQIRFANGMWVKEGFSICPCFSNLLQTHFAAEVATTPFNEESVEEINRWVAEKTEKKIQNLLSPDLLNEETRLVLVNSLYFKGYWLSSFDSTHSDIFHAASKEDIETSFMTKENTFSYAETEDCQIVSLPLQKEEGVKISCLLLLPKGEARSLPSLSKLFPIPFFSKKRVALQVPKFKIESSFSLAESLKSLGLKTAFSDTADFSSITPLEPLHLNEVVHKTLFDFNEQGIEAAAATAVLIERTTAIPHQPPLSFIANRPFYFVLYEENEEDILFIGAFNRP